MPNLTRIDFPELAGPGEEVWVEVVDPRWLSHETFAGMMEAIMLADGGQQAQVDLRRIAPVLAGLVARWSMPDPRTGQPLPQPTDDPSAIARAPARVTLALLRHLTEAARELAPKN